MPYVPVRQRKREQVVARSARARQLTLEEEQKRRREEEERRRKARPTQGPQASKTLMDEFSRVRGLRKADEEDEIAKQLKEEAEIMKAITETKALMSVEELAKGVRYSEPIKTGWRAPKHIRERPQRITDLIRARYHIEADGEDVPPPIKSFREMKIPPPLLRFLKEEKKVVSPTPIQIQALPAIFTGRDVIGVAFTGSGKSLCFTLPAVMHSLEQERKMPFVKGEGPYALMLSPSRELAKQTCHLIREYANVLAEAGQPRLRVLLVTGGINMAEQADEMHNGTHIVVATPGRLIDMLEKRKLNLSCCRFLALDEADRMVDSGGFEEEMRTIFSFFRGQRQTLLFSATMPTKIKDFARTAMVKPITVNISRGGAANFDIIQEVECRFRVEGGGGRRGAQTFLNTQVPSWEWYGPRQMSNTPSLPRRCQAGGQGGVSARSAAEDAAAGADLQCAQARCGRHVRVSAAQGG